MVYIYFLIGHIRPVCSLFENKSILKNLIQIVQGNSLGASRKRVMLMNTYMQQEQKEDDFAELFQGEMNLVFDGADGESELFMES